MYVFLSFFFHSNQRQLRWTFVLRYGILSTTVTTVEVLFA